MPIARCLHWGPRRTQRTEVTLEGEATQRVVQVARLRDNTTLRDRPEWLGPRDLQEVFGIGSSKSFKVCNALPHINIGRSIRVHKSTITKELLEKGRLP